MMTNLLAVVILLAGTPQPTPTADAVIGIGKLPREASTLIIPGASVGPIDAKTTREDLVRLYGAENVADADLYLGEGESVPAWHVHAKTANRHIAVSHENGRATEVTIFGSVWATKEGVHAGVTLAELERINGKAFTMSGFSWDYAGTILDFEGGTLAYLHENPRVTIRMALPEGASEAGIKGDRDLSSHLPAMRKAKPFVAVIIVPLEKKKEP